MKELPHRIFNEEEKEFIKKYGENNLYAWELISDSQKQEYQELENYYSIFSELFSEHYEDLKLYALMYRNVPLYNCSNDAFSILFFASKKNEIIGYKDKLLENKNAIKTQILFLYYENEALFPKLCIKYAHVNFQPNKKIDKYQKLNPYTLSLFKRSDYSNIFSINDLTDEQCKLILSHTNNLSGEYSDLYNAYLGDWETSSLWKGTFKSKEEFAENCYIPLFNSINSFEQEQVVKYLFQEYGTEIVKNDINGLKENQSKITNSESKIVELKDKIAKLEDKLKNGIELKLLDSYYYNERKRLEYAINCYSYNRERLNEEHRKALFKMSGVRPTAEIMQELENQKKEIKEFEAQHERNKKRLAEIERNDSIEREREKERKARLIQETNEQIAKLKNEMQDVQNLQHADYAMMIKNVTASRTFNIIYDNKTAIEQLYRNSCEEMYNISWMKAPKEMQEKEMHATNGIFHAVEYRRGRIFRWVKSKKTHEFFYRYLPSELMGEWCSVIQEKKKQEERAKKLNTNYINKLTVNNHYRDDGWWETGEKIEFDFYTSKTYFVAQIYTDIIFHRLK